MAITAHMASIIVDLSKFGPRGLQFVAGDLLARFLDRSGSTAS
jgi:hypothetical protein